MARSINRLSARKAATESKRGLHADGGGLYLQVSKYDTRSWLFRFTLNKKERQMGLGPIHTVSLAEARDEAAKCRKLLRQGIDPIEDRNAQRARQNLDVVKTITFKDAAKQYIQSHSAGWSNVKHAAQWTSTLETYAYPVFGNLPVSGVDTGLVLKVLETIWTTKTETATRVRARIESILSWATVRKYRQGENPALWKGHLDNLLPSPSKVRKVVHHPALPYDQIGGFIPLLKEQSGVSARGLEFLLLTASRTSEVLEARWDELDMDKAQWTIPEERMKSGKEHRVPLSEKAMDVLRHMEQVTQGEFIFFGMRPGSPLSNMAFRQLLKRMGYRDITTHGFRSTFRDWAAEQTSFPHEVAEMALAHAVPNKVEAAYRRGDMFEKRRRLMDDWAKFCFLPGSIKTANVVTIRKQG